MIAFAFVQYDDGDDENPLKGFAAKCVASPNTFVPTHSYCYGDTGAIWEDHTKRPRVSKNYCCSNADHCNDCPLELLTIPGVISLLPPSCKLPDIPEELTTTPTPHFESSTVTGKC